jgi:recombination protein RecA
MQLFGPESSGKSTISTFIAKEIQQILVEEQPIVLYVDYERSFDPVYAERLGLNLDDDHFMLVQPDTMEDGFEIIEALVKSGKIGLVIFDSETTAPTRSQEESEYGKAGFGPQAKILADSLRKINIQLAKYKTSMIVISQERDNMDVGSHAIKTTGGRALKFYASTRNRVTRVETIEEGGETIGIKVKIRNYKNKTGIMYRDAEMTLYFDRGFDVNAEYIDFFLRLGLVVQNGAYFKSDEYGFNCQGRAKLQAWFDEHPDVFEKMKKSTLELLGKESKELDGDKQVPDEVENDKAEEEETAAALADLALKAAEGEEVPPDLNV